MVMMSLMLVNNGRTPGILCTQPRIGSLPRGNDLASWLDQLIDPWGTPIVKRHDQAGG